MELKPKAIATAMQKNTTSCSPDSTDPQMSTRIWLDVGHAYEPRRWVSGRAVAQDWRVWVRGVADADISAFVDKVVFQMSPESQFPYHKKIFVEPPYQIQEGGSAPTEIHIDVYFKCTMKPERIQLKYGPLFKNSIQSSADSRCIYYDIQSPSEQLRTALMQSKPSIAHSGSVLVVLPNSGEVRPQSQQRTRKRKRCEYIEPKKIKLLAKCSQCEHSRQDSKKSKPPGEQTSSVLELPNSGEVPHNHNSHQNWTTKRKTCDVIKPIETKHLNKKTKKMKLPNKCSKCEQSRLDFKNLLRQGSMPKLTENEIEHVSQMYLAHNAYEKSGNALPLPPLSDPLYRMPVLPPSLRRARALAGVEIDYALQ